MAAGKSAGLDMEFLRNASNRGKDLLVIASYKFSKAHVTKDGRTRWRCTRKTCGASVVTEETAADEIRIVTAKSSHKLVHNHKSNSDALERQVLKNAMKEEGVSQEIREALWNRMKMGGGRNGDSLPLRLGDGDMSSDDVSALWGGYHHSMKKQMDTDTSPIPQETNSLHDETSSSGNKEDEDDDDDEADEKLDSQQFDPERLKAFNMFVRLFVDENLDRIVPISKQPKEKIQAIIDSCTRQFPEFAERARKRIRTYLKSCRRTKRSRDTGQPWEVPSTGRPTPAHLTSVAAEQILAQACENESHNAKRMRLGLEPVGQPLPVTQQQLQQQQQQQQQIQQQQQQLQIQQQQQQQQQQQMQQAAERREAQYTSPIPDIKPTLNALSVEQLVKTNGSATSSAAPTALYRPNFGQAFQRSGPTYPGPQGMFPTQPFNPAQLIGGAPTDLSMKTKPLLNHKLNPTEMAAVRQLVTGYRESAAFLLRSADELEQLLLQQQ